MMKQTCCRCKQNLDILKYYRTKKIIKYPVGRLNICKYCINKELENNPEFFKWILQEVDVPYIKQEWENYEERNEKGICTLGKYLSKMRLMSFKNFTYEDSGRLNDEYEKRRERLKELSQNALLR